MKKIHQKKQKKVQKREILKDAYHKYIKIGMSPEDALRATIMFYRFLKQYKLKGISDKNAIMAAIAFITVRAPYTFPNDIPIQYYAKLFNVKGTSVEWFLKKIEKTLGIKRLHDLRHFPYFLDPNSVVYKVIENITHKIYQEEKIKNLLGIELFDEETVINKIIDELLNRLKIIPSVFRLSLYGLIEKIMKPK